MRNQVHFLVVVLVSLLFGLHCNGQKLTPISGINSSPKGTSENHIAPILQEVCGFDFFHNQKMESDPQYKADYQNTLKSMLEVSSQNRGLAGDVLQIPVVVHVMHLGESVGVGTNISDEDVKRGIKYLNNYWRKISGSKGDGMGVDMRIEFVLAVQDESGNCTDGIDRVDMSSVPAYVNHGVNVENADGLADHLRDAPVNSLKEYSIWDPTKYYNVWIVDKIDSKNCTTGGSFTAGYAFGAIVHGQAFDGSVVLICSYLNESSSTWAHEMGHAFNLPHTFDGDDDTNGDGCGEDGIIDTPKHKRTLGHPGLYFACETTQVNPCDPSFSQIINPETGFLRSGGTFQDHMHNYMDYSGCTNEFTGGQRAVANNALNINRASFLSSPALTPPSRPTVAFSSTSTSACLGSEVIFTDDSACTPNSFTNSGSDNVTFLWTFNNGVDTPVTSTDQNPTIVFDKIGAYDVSLNVTNVHGTNSLTKAKNIFVTSGVLATCAPNSANKDNNFGCGVTNVSFGSINNSTSTFIPSSVRQDFTCSDNTTIHLGSSYDLDVSYKSRVDGITYLEVWIDWDNSGTFDRDNSKGIDERVLTHNIPASETGSPSISITPPETASLNTMLTMRVISDFNYEPLLCGQGYVQRADDYGIIVSETLSVNEFSNSKLRMYPNPTNNYLTFALENKDAIKGYEVYDVTGKKVIMTSKVENNTINVSRLPNGFYFVKVETDTLELIGKFIKE